MRKTVIAGNWKMNGTNSSIVQLMDNILSDIQPKENVDIVVFPPYVYLSQVSDKLAESAVFLGAQNVSNQDRGAYTGEISAEMLQDFGCKYVLVGHSERRHIYGESSELIAKKYFQAVKYGLTPILCVGETESERKNEQTEDVIVAQLSALTDLDQGLESLASGIIAYEPVWAIGTGLTASKEIAQEVHGFIRAWIAKRDAALAEKIPLLYGGSVNKDNAGNLLGMPDIDGLLVGGASLNAEQFWGIIKCTN